MDGCVYLVDWRLGLGLGLVAAVGKELGMPVSETSTASILLSSPFFFVRKVRDVTR